MTISYNMRIAKVIQDLKYLNRTIERKGGQPTTAQVEELLKLRAELKDIKEGRGWYSDEQR